MFGASRPPQRIEIELVEYPNNQILYLADVVVSVARASSKQRACVQASNVVTLDELVGHPVTLLEKCDHVRDKLQARSHFVLVDEVQDCDVRQYRLVQLLAARHGNVFFVGDPNQSIYAFRGSQVCSRPFSLLPRSLCVRR